MGFGSFIGKVGKIIRNGGRLVRNVIDKGKKIFGKISPYIKRGFEIASKVPGVIDNIRKTKDRITSRVDDIVNLLPESKIKDKIRHVVDKGKEYSDKIINTGQNIYNRARPWIDTGQNIYRKIDERVSAKPAKM